MEEKKNKKIKKKTESVFKQAGKICRKSSLLYSVASYRKLALMSAGEDSKCPCSVYCEGARPPSCASWLGKGSMQGEETKLCTCQ